MKNIEYSPKKCLANDIHILNCMILQSFHPTLHSITFIRIYFDVQEVVLSRCVVRKAADGGGVRTGGPGQCGLEAVDGVA